MPVNFHLNADEVAYILEDSGATVLFLGPGTAAAGIDDRARFVREAQALARLRHPHVVALHEVGEHRERHPANHA